MKIIITSLGELLDAPCIDVWGTPLLKKEDLKSKTKISHPIDSIPEWVKIHLKAGFWVELEISTKDSGRKTKKGNPVYMVEYNGCKNAEKDWEPYLEDIREGEVDGEKCIYLYTQESSKIKNSTRWSAIKIEDYKNLPERLQSQAKAMLEAFEWNKSNVNANLREEIVKPDPLKWSLEVIGSSTYVRVHDGYIKKFVTKATAENLNGVWVVSKKEKKIHENYLTCRVEYDYATKRYDLVEVDYPDQGRAPLSMWSVIKSEKFLETKEVSYQEVSLVHDGWDRYDNDVSHHKYEWKKKTVDVYQVTAALPEALRKGYEGMLPMEVTYLIRKNH